MSLRIRHFVLMLLPWLPLGAAAWEFTEHPGRPLAAPLALDDLAGNRVTLEAHRGKVVVVNFWATWCPPCVAEMPSLDRLRQQLGRDRFEVLAVNTGDEPFDISLFLREIPVGLPILLDPELRTQAAWDVRVLPTTFVVDPEGRVRYREIGDREWDDPGTVAALRALAGALPAQVTFDRH